MDWFRFLAIILNIRGGGHLDAFIALALVLLVMVGLLRNRASAWLVLSLAIVLCSTLIALSGAIAGFRS